MNQFSPKKYIEILKIIKEQYKLIPACQALDKRKNNNTRKCILRHDIDYSLEHAFNMACLESELGVQSTYYFLLDSNWYNLFNQDTKKILKDICGLNHEVGLHFHAINLIKNKDGWLNDLYLQKLILENVADRKVESFSYHCPGVVGLESLNRDDVIADMINCYSLTLEKNFVYQSDSLRKFKDPNFLKCLKSGAYQNLHLLAHPILWQEKLHKMDDIILEHIKICQEKLKNEWDITKQDYKIS